MWQFTYACAYLTEVSCTYTIVVAIAWTSCVSVCAVFLLTRVELRPVL